MSMNFSEFKRLVGADPRSSEPSFLRARHSSPEFETAAAEAERFEVILERATRIRPPDDLLEGLLAIGRQPPARDGDRRWLPIALAASLLLAAGAGGWIWNRNHSWDSVEDYVADHYRHDGNMVPSGASLGEVQALFSGLNMQAATALADIVGVIKYCPTPDGKGIHMILNTPGGPVTVIYMPDTPVVDREMFAFDNMNAILVKLKSGSAAIIGPDQQSISGLYSFVQDSILPASENS
jgi:hypothetical protein